MAKLTTKAFTAVQSLPGGKPWIMAWATAALAGQVRVEVGKTWDTDRQGWKNGWRKAQKAGIRVVKVTLSADLGKQPTGT